MLALLKAQWVFFGIKAPCFSWLISIALIVFSVIILVKHFSKTRAAASALNKVGSQVSSLQYDHPPRPGSGLSTQAYDAISRIFEELPQLSTIWNNLKRHIIRRVDNDGQDKFWLAEEPEKFVNESTVFDMYWYRGWPGIITGVGLLFTFLAILVALFDVHLDAKRVQGLDLLIQGLSGKFISSVVALSCATILLLCEKPLLHPIQMAISRLVSVLSANFPSLTSTQILADIQKDISAQSNAFRIFNADLAVILKKSFGESVNPTLDRMVAAIDELNELLRAAEAQKHESMTEQIGALLKSLEQSMASSLERMGDQFNTSLSGTAHTQFENVTASLTSTAVLLEQMNNQFAANQAVLSDLINTAKATTAEQMQTGQARVEELTGVLRELMIQLQSQAGESIGTIERTLAAVTLDLSNKVTDLTVQMASMVEDASERSTKSAKDILDQAGNLSSRSAEQLSHLLERHSSELTRVEDLRTLLDKTLKEFSGSTERYGQITGDMRRLTSEISLAAGSLSQISKAIRDTQEAATKVSLSASSQIESARAFVQNQKDLWDKIQGSMQQYENVFKKVEGHSKELLSHIGVYLGDYSTTTQKHYEKLGTIANNYISEATQKIGSSVDDLSVQLDELQTVVEKIAKTARATVR
jgi:hypothetical protein